MTVFQFGIVGSGLCGPLGSLVCAFLGLCLPHSLASLFSWPLLDCILSQLHGLSLVVLFYFYAYISMRPTEHFAGWLVPDFLSLSLYPFYRPRIA